MVERVRPSEIAAQVLALLKRVAQSELTQVSIAVILWSIARDLIAAKKEAAGGGAGRRGHGVMEVQTLSKPVRAGGASPGLEREAIVRLGARAVDSPKGSIRSGTEVLPGPRMADPEFCPVSEICVLEERSLLSPARRLDQRFRGYMRNACVVKRFV